MKKIPTLFKREFEDHNVVKCLPEITPGMEWVLDSQGIATIKYDGSCCAVINGKFYRRYDAKHGKPVPENAIKCQEVADPITGHLPCWIPCDRSNPTDKWFWQAFDNYSKNNEITDGTYEAIGLHFNANPYDLEEDKLIRHSKDIVEVERSFNGIKEFLEINYIEGIVFWKDGEPRCKIKRSDFGYDWNDGKHPTYIKELEEELKESNDKIKKYKLLLNEFNLEECCEMCKHRDISRFEDTCYECICGKNHFEAKYPDEIKELLADNPRWTRNSAM